MPIISGETFKPTTAVIGRRSHGVRSLFALPRVSQSVSRGISSLPASASLCVDPPDAHIHAHSDLHTQLLLVTEPFSLIWESVFPPWATKRARPGKKAWTVDSLRGDFGVRAAVFFARWIFRCFSRGVFLLSLRNERSYGGFLFFT